MSAQAKGGVSRRGFLAISAATLGGVLIAPGVRLIEIAAARAPEQGVSKQVRWGLLIDTNKCTPGCDACVKACNTENGLRSTGHPRTDAQWIRKVELKDKRTGHESSVPVMCQHCEHPPCVDVCPTGASFKRADGIVLVDRHICIGCRYCIMACPYKARSIVFQALAGQNPEVPRGNGCAEACSHDGGGALLFGDLNDPRSAIHQALATFPTTQVRADLGLDVGVRYRGL